jgi:hypothetical protein
VEEGQSVYATDLDQDGDLDVLSASSRDGKIAWYENTDGKGSFAMQRIIDSFARMAHSVYASDMDGDGDVDIVAATAYVLSCENLAWYENMDGQGTFGTKHTILTGPGSVARSVYASDIDGDGDIDILSASYVDNTITWYENTDSHGTFVNQHVITTHTQGPYAAYPADMDGDGDIDVVSASSKDNTIAWYENTDGKGAFGPQRVVTTIADGARTVHASDLDGDGDIDILSAADHANMLLWHENTDGKGTFSNPIIITASVERVESVFAADVDGDGDVDVSASHSDEITWYENTDGKGVFGNQRIITTEADRASSVYAADVDGDGDLDVLSASRDLITRFENKDGKGTFGNEQALTTPSFISTSIQTSDLDGDGDLDILMADLRGSVAWYENTDGQGTFGIQRAIAMEDVRSVLGVDIDGDGDADVLSSSRDGQVGWYENTHGQGTFDSRRVFADGVYWNSGVSTADIDGDADVDVLLALYGEHTIVWYENTDGQGTFSPAQVVTTLADGALEVSTTDVDGDGDLDILSASSLDDKVAWYENLDGRGAFGPQRIVSVAANGARTVTPADFDGDGDMDILAASDWQKEEKIAWYENTDGQGTFGEERVITTEVLHTDFMYTTDLDGDGDVDVISPSLDGKIAWYENMDGKGEFGIPRIITPYVQRASAAHASDVDGDGDIDVLMASDDGRIAWSENLARVIGDSNRDGIFNSSDLVVIFQAGKYEDGIPESATFEEGDWNGDSEFDSADLVLAFQRGHYRSGNAAPIVPSSEAVDSLFDETNRHGTDLRYLHLRWAFAGQRH